MLDFEAKAGGGDWFKGQAVEAVEGSGVRRSVFDGEIVAAGIAVEEAPADGDLVGAVERRIIKPVDFDGRGGGRLRKIVLDPFDRTLFRAKREIAGGTAFRINDGQIVVEDGENGQIVGQSGRRESKLIL